MSRISVQITLEMEDDEAWAYAQFLKRVLLDDYKARAQDEDEAYRMREAGLKVQQALRDAGYDPR